jgi:hypothetical protein
MHHNGADACWSHASTVPFTAMQQNMAGIQLAAMRGAPEKSPRLVDARAD